MNATEIFCESFQNTVFEDFSEQDIERAKYRLLDSFGVITAGKDGSGNDMALSLIRQWGGNDEATVFNHGDKVPAHIAAFINSLMMRSYDFEPVQSQGRNGASGPAHISGSTVPVSLAMAEWKKSSGKKMLTAMLLGEDLACRLAAAGDSSPFTNPWDNTGTINGLGAVVTAGYLLNLDKLQMRNAMGIVLNQLGGSTGSLYNRSMTFKLPMALAAKNSIFSAELAQKGFTAGEDAITGQAGYFELFCDGYNVEELLADLGKVHYAEVVHKPYSACRATHPAIDCAIEIKQQNNPAPESIDVIQVHMKKSTVDSFVGGDFEIGDAPEVNGLFSLKFTVADGLLNGCVKPEHLSKEKMMAPVIQSLMSKVELIGDIDPASGKVAVIDVIMKNGDRYQAKTGKTAKGDIFINPISNSQIIDKYYDNIKFGGKMIREEAEKALDFIMNIERKSEIAPLIALFS